MADGNYGDKGSYKTKYTSLPGYEKLRMSDHMTAKFKGTDPETNAQTGQVVDNPRLEYMRQQIHIRTEEEKQAAAEAARRAAGK